MPGRRHQWRKKKPHKHRELLGVVKLKGQRVFLGDPKLKHSKANYVNLAHAVPASRVDKEWAGEICEEVLVSMLQQSFCCLSLFFIES